MILSLLKKVDGRVRYRDETTVRLEKAQKGTYPPCWFLIKPGDLQDSRHLHFITPSVIGGQARTDSGAARRVVVALVVTTLPHACSCLLPTDYITTIGFVSHCFQGNEVNRGKSVSLIPWHYK
ncbi:hypothetical protein J6590_044169 [Homalodisca vitripennis]|nr:hypothetical protein J6590_044169 [Homalodisca vitripennis]